MMRSNRRAQTLASSNRDSQDPRRDYRELSKVSLAQDAAKLYSQVARTNSSAVKQRKLIQPTDFYEGQSRLQQSQCYDLMTTAAQSTLRKTDSNGFSQHVFTLMDRLRQQKRLDNSGTSLERTVKDSCRDIEEISRQKRPTTAVTAKVASASLANKPLIRSGFFNTNKYESARAQYSLALTKRRDLNQSQDTLRDYSGGFSNLIEKEAKQSLRNQSMIEGEESNFTIGKVVYRLQLPRKGFAINLLSNYSSMGKRERKTQF